MSKQIQYLKNKDLNNDIFYMISIVMAGLVLPVFLIPVVKFFGHTEIIEEIAKALIVLFLILKLPTNKIKILYGFFFGLLFGLSESIFYFNNIFELGNFSVLGQRFLWTIPMHIITVLLMVLTGLIKKGYLIFGFIGALILHALFNLLLVDMII